VAVSASAIAGFFHNGSPTGKALSALVNNVEVMNVNETGVHAGAGMTSTPFAYAIVDNLGNILKGSSNITCTLWLTGMVEYRCALSAGGIPIPYDPAAFVVLVTPASLNTSRGNAFPFVRVAIQEIGIEFHNSGGSLTTGFSIAVFRI
jgi:hypothetical protein